MLSSFRTIAFSRKMVVTYVIGAALLAVSFYGFHKWMQAVADTTVPSDTGLRIADLVGLGVAPLVLFLILAMRAGIHIGQTIASIGFQFRIDQLQKRLNGQDDFYRAINDYNPSGLTIFNNENEYWLINTSAAQSLNSNSNDVLGKRPSSVMGIDAGRKLERSLDYVRQKKKPLEVLAQGVDKNGQIRYTQTSYQLLAPFGDFPGGILAREENVTTILVERERRENMLRQVISTLVAVVDRRDPYAAGHSQRVGQLSRALAIELQLSEKEIDAAEIAGSLMNFGKILVSRAILTKSEPLTPEELQRIRDGIMTSADILSLIDFSTPVVPTLRQTLEHVDGTGVPEGLQGDAILMTARIVAVANAFVAMVSPRAYRPGAEFSVAAKRLEGAAGKTFDGKVISALEVFLNKNKHKLEWLSGNKQTQV